MQNDAKVVVGSKWGRRWHLCNLCRNEAVILHHNRHWVYEFALKRIPRCANGHGIL